MGVLLCGCAADQPITPPECAQCTYVNNPYGEFFSPTGGNRLLRTVKELEWVLYADARDHTVLKSADGSVERDLSQVVMERYRLRNVYLSCGVYDAYRNSVWIGVYWRGTDSEMSARDSTVIVEYSLTTFTMQEYRIDHIWPGTVDAPLGDRITIVDAYYMRGECRLITNTFEQLVLRGDRLELAPDDPLSLKPVKARIVASSSGSPSVVWRYVPQPESSTYMFDNKVLSIPSLAAFKPMVCDYDAGTRTFLVSTVIDSCAYRIRIPNFTKRAARIDFCVVERETADTIYLKPRQSFNLLSTDCIIVQSDYPPRFSSSDLTVTFTGYYWGDNSLRLYQWKDNELTPLW